MFTLIIEDKHGGIADEYSFEEGEFFIGRSHTSDIILPSDNVSRRHARLYTVDGRCYIEDLASSNGVFVNGRRIHEVYQIQRSAQIKVGDYYLHIESDTEASPEEERTWCRLTGRNLAFTNQVFRVQRKVNLIGRGKDCTLTIIDPSVSRIHTKLSVERSGALTIEDLKSSNGTFVNDERIEVATLHHRDILRLGNVEFLVEIPDQEATNIGKSPSPRERERVREQVREREPAREARRERSVSAPLPVEERLSADKKPPTLEEAWSMEAPKRSGSSWVLWTLVIGFVALIATIVLVAFKDEIFGGADEPPPGAAATAPATSAGAPTPPAPSAEEIARKRAQELEKRHKEIQAILQVGRDYMKDRRWDLATGRFNAVLELDPANAEALRSLNHIQMMEKHKARLEEARRLRDALKRGEAARILREIDDASVYYTEAQDELHKLQDAKPTLLLTADNLVRQRDCQGAITTLKEAQLIDPKDPVVIEKLDQVNALLGTRKCQ